jgi:GntR family transcriptional regulator
MRLLATELRIKREPPPNEPIESSSAMDFIETVMGKGSFCAAQGTELLREEQLRTVQEHAAKGVDAARSCGVLGARAAQKF